MVINIYNPVQPLGEGYIAIIIPKLERADVTCNKLLTEKEYNDCLTINE